jgi:hypothetical protein
MDNALTLAEMAIVTDAAQCFRRDNTRVFVELKPVEIEINGTAMKRLQFGGWLQDDHINGYMYLLDRAGPVNRLLAFSSFFMVKLMNDGGGYSYAGVRRWTKKVDIFAYAHLAIPYNVSRSHWVLLHIDNDAKKVCCYDSYGLVSQTRNWRAHSVFAGRVPSTPSGKARTILHIYSGWQARSVSALSRSKCDGMRCIPVFRCATHPSWRWPCVWNGRNSGLPLVHHSRTPREAHPLITACTQRPARHRRRVMMMSSNTPACSLRVLRRQVGPRAGL